MIHRAQNLRAVRSQGKAEQLSRILQERERDQEKNLNAFLQRNAFFFIAQKFICVVIKIILLKKSSSGNKSSYPSKYMFKIPYELLTSSV